MSDARWNDVELTPDDGWFMVPAPIYETLLFLYRMELNYDESGVIEAMEALAGFDDLPEVSDDNGHD